MLDPNNTFCWFSKGMVVEDKVDKAEESIIIKQFGVYTMGKQAFNQTKNLVPKVIVHLSASRVEIHSEAQALAFLAGANSIFTGDKLLNMPNHGTSEDHRLIAVLGLKARMPDKKNDEGVSL
jgi:hypothetical protein